MVMMQGQLVRQLHDIERAPVPERPLAPALKQRAVAQHAELLRMLATPGQGGVRLSETNARLSDEMLLDLFATVAAERSMDGILMGAVGGYGRNLLGLRSDLDLCFVTDRSRESVSEQVEALMYPLWDAGISVGHQIVCVGEAAADAARDLVMATELLNFRPLAGDKRLHTALSDALNADFFVPGHVTSFIEGIEEQAVERHEHFGDSVYLLEPDVKNGTGGLRDLDFALWAAQARLGTGELARLHGQGVITDEELLETRAALEFLWTVRNHLHHLAGRKADRLTFGDQAHVARAMGYLPGNADALEPLVRDGVMVESFMSEYYRHARVVVRASELILGRAKRRVGLGASEFERIDDDFLCSEAGVGFVDLGVLAERPLLALQIFELALLKQRKVLSRSRDAVAQAAARPQFGAKLRDSKEAGALFLKLLTDCQTAPFTAQSILGELHDVGLLLAMIPEFSPLVGRVHHDLYHVYTVDVHSVAAVDRLRALVRGDHAEKYPLASRMAAEISRPHVLFMATLLHDVGKAIGGKDHAQRGAEMARDILPRFGFEAEEIDDVRHLILHHLTMYMVAVRRDLSDPHAIAEFVADVPGREALRELYLLTVADVSTTSPTSMNKWKSSMLNTLYREAHQVFCGDASAGELRVERQRAHVRELCPEGDRERLEAYLRSMPRRYLLSNSPKDILAHARVVTTLNHGPVECARVPSDEDGVLKLCVVAESSVSAGLCVVTGDRPGLLAAIAAAIAASGLRIRSAQVNSRALPDGSHQAVDLFSVRADEEDGLIERKLEKLRAMLPDIVRGKVVVETLARGRAEPSWSRRQLPPVPTEVLFDHHGSGSCTIIEVLCQDRPGLLYTLSQALYASDVSICLAKISTEGKRVIDVFYVTEADGSKLADGPRTAQIRAALLSALDSANTARN